MSQCTFQGGNMSQRPKPACQREKCSGSDSLTGTSGAPRRFIAGWQGRGYTKNISTTSVKALASLGPFVEPVSRFDYKLISVWVFEGTEFSPLHLKRWRPLLPYSVPSVEDTSIQHRRIEIRWKVCALANPS